LLRLFALLPAGRPALLLGD